MWFVLKSKLSLVYAWFPQPEQARRKRYRGVYGSDATLNMKFFKEPLKDPVGDVDAFLFGCTRVSNGPAMMRALVDHYTAESLHERIWSGNSIRTLRTADAGDSLAIKLQAV
jgi:hypothetical protein